ncbi:plant intracellular Ras-group-related LRR protein 1-like [Pyrus ussuriensis x Pyrus communis]|uniref:Plant intracellular Ras-group-related LRR protein 1-like n=1 Tax=Pyrus ussuriensis x Pyrus communis TaxID=2448454 RepID=A0A5N5HRS0_9ROSA|nr:plant intracellular Ras-group-related LRR protein 1-like [Pyrus ussuriensis x Pyrus communis]
MKFEWLVGGMVALNGIEFPGLKLFERGGVDEIVIGLVVEGFADGTSLEDIGDAMLNDGEDFGVREVGHLIKDGVLIGGMGTDADFAEVRREK